MRAEDALAAMRALPPLDYVSGFGVEPVLVLAPHPDDESLGCGGLIAEACSVGITPIVAVLTDGAGSHPHSERYPAERLSSLRESEALAATTVLGLPGERVSFLRQPDTAAPMSGPAFQAVVAELIALIRRHACRTVVASWRHDPHCDHEAAASIAAAVCRETGARLFGYPVWGWTLPPGTEIDQTPIRGFRLEVSRHLVAKRAAIMAHRSQYAGLIDDDPEGFQLSPDFIDRFLGTTEVYMEVPV